ncbi:hypothetical protein MMC30_001251 [Trapelia coarctata]|nr:hypothetical protein [Trapelia coarctata]
MQQDLVKQWLDSADVEQPPLERPSKRRRLNPRNEEALEWPLSPSSSPRAQSEDYRPNPSFDTSSLSRPSQQDQQDSYVGPAARIYSCSRYIGVHRDGIRYQKQGGTDPDWRTAVGSVHSRLRRSKSDSCLLDYLHYTRTTVQQPVNMSMPPPPSPSATSRSVASVPPASDRGRTPSRDGQSDASRASSASRIGIKASNYRSNVLVPNGVHIVNASVPLGSHLAAEADSIRHKRGDSPVMSEGEAKEICRRIQLLEDEAEMKMGQQLQEWGLLPKDSDGVKYLKITEGLPFKSKAVVPCATIPQGFSNSIQPIVEPRPDIAYGYKVDGFNNQQALSLFSTIGGVDLAKVAMPAKDLYWPFLVVEFKALATGGNIYFATNQCAGDGSACVKGAHTLFEFALQAAKNQGPDSPSSQAVGDSGQLEPIAYSAAIDGKVAELFIHWYEPENNRYHLRMIQDYHLTRPDEMSEFRAHMRNVVDWGTTSRLEKVKNALDAVFEDQTRAGQRKRPASPPSS